MTTRTSIVFLDPIVEETREIKRRLAEKFDYDVGAMLKDAQKRQTRGGRKVVSPPGKIAAAAKRPSPSRHKGRAAPR